MKLNSNFKSEHPPLLMKTTSSLLLALALLNTAQAGLITDPLGVLLPPNPGTPPPVNYRLPERLPLNVNEMDDLASYPRPGSSNFETGLQYDLMNGETEAEFPDYLPLDEMRPIILDENGVPVTRHFSEGAEVMDWIVGLIGNLSTDSTLRLSDLMMNPAVHAALHAPGPEGDELRGYMDWLIMTGLVIGFDGMDGSDDLYGNQGDDELADQAPEGIILGGPGGDTLQPYNPSIILGGPGGDTLAGDSQDHNPDVFND